MCCPTLLAPGQLSPLLDYITGLLSVPGEESRAAAAIDQVLHVVLAVGGRYRKQQDLFSVVLLYEATQMGGLEDFRAYG